MKVAVIGSGAMGCLYGGYLARSGVETWLYDVWPEHVQTMRERGLIIEDRDGEHTIPVRATLDVVEIGVVDLMIIFVKSTQTALAVENARSCIGPDTLVLTLQNGLGNIEAITAHVDSRQVLAGVTSNGCTLLGPGRIRHAGVGTTHIGPVTGVMTPAVAGVVDLFNGAGLTTEASPNAVGMLWTKLVTNVGINALTAITGLLNGQLLEHSELLEIMDGAIAEVERVAVARGIRLEVEDPKGHVRQVCRATAANRSSMLQDVSNKRRTEIDAINGAVVREATDLNINVPYNRILTNLVKVIEKTY